MKIFIAGCARSGTTLLTELMRCFADIYVHDQEAPQEELDKLVISKRNSVVKRTYRCWESLDRLPDDRTLIYCLRHPFDVLTSVHPISASLRPFHVTPERWINEYAALGRLRAAKPNRPVCFVRYEDLVTDPDDVQHKIQAQFGLCIEHQFSGNPAGATFNRASIRKWKRDPSLRDYLSGLPVEARPSMRQFSQEFDYRLPHWFNDG